MHKNTTKCDTNEIQDGRQQHFADFQISSDLWLYLAQKHILAVDL